MATTRTFNSMINEYLPNELLMAEYLIRDWLLQNTEMDNGWKGGNLIVPFEGTHETSVEFGQLAASNDVAEANMVRGVVSSYKEVWGTLKLNHTDLMQHDGKIPETTFLRLVPQRMEKLLGWMKQAVSQQLLIGSHFAKFTADGTAGGVIAVDKINKFRISQKIAIDDDNSAALTCYVIAISIDASTITVSATRGGAAADVSAYTTAQNAKIYHPGVLTNGAFTSLRESLLSAANGGSTSLYGVTKTSWPFLQAVNIDGSSWTASTILENCFDAYMESLKKGQGNANTVVMSYKHMAAVMKKLESQKGPYFITKQPSTTVFGWTEITIASVKGSLKFVAVQEMDDDVVMFLDMKAFKFYTNGGFKKRKSPEGQEYFEVRGTDGYSYLVDICLFGEFVLHMPSSCAIAYGISY